MTFLENVYGEMKSLNLVTSTDELSTKYLGKSESYARVIKAKKEDLSISALVRLAERLKADNDALATSDTSWFSKYSFASKDSVEQRNKRIRFVQQAVLDEVQNRVFGTNRHFKITLQHA